MINTLSWNIAFLAHSTENYHEKMEISQRLGIRREYALPQGKYDVLNGKEKSRGGGPISSTGEL
ncbi:protein of unknown function [Pseudodesulfovibrio piezophilus C1TLV30]|uniref:Uncharacterized protein n=1 Tax=Pseudodesulfovibrio piezophilus (strain DSM 21447 / JCM 15486 / C1TLV30) TaxID=1322246 RepID=M1WP06_PSEP2|nr:protein of unknown function [Pseudodesulfovibrio piezophilus C1TLV30]